MGCKIPNVTSWIVYFIIYFINMELSAVGVVEGAK
jgi:hypothetical protein